MMMNDFAMIGMEPMLIIFVVVLVLFGGKKIPELMRGVGQGVGELQKGLEEGKAHLNASLHADTTPRPTTYEAPAAPATPAPSTPAAAAPAPEVKPAEDHEKFNPNSVG